MEKTSFSRTCRHPKSERNGLEYRRCGDTFEGYAGIGEREEREDRERDPGMKIVLKLLQRRGGS